MNSERALGVGAMENGVLHARGVPLSKYLQLSDCMVDVTLTFKKTQSPWILMCTWLLNRLPIQDQSLFDRRYRSLRPIREGMACIFLVDDIDDVIAIGCSVSTQCC